MSAEKNERERKRNQTGTGATAREIQEELSFLRQKCSSLAIRGRYTECIKAIEENLQTFYSKERWPENFLSVLRLHQKCYPSLQKPQSHTEYMSALFKKNGIPFAFAQLLLEKDNEIGWTTEGFRDRVLQSETEGDLELALSYSDILIKLDPGSANAYLLKGRVLESMGRGTDALRLYERSLEMSPANRHALSSLAGYYGKTDPQKALQLIEEAIDAAPNEPGPYAMKATILWEMKDREGARAAMEAAMKHDPYNADLPYQLGEMYLEEPNRVKAIAQYRMAIALNEKHLPSLMRLAEMSAEGQPDLALTYINTVHTLEPENRVASLLRARLLQRTGELEAAAKQYRALIELDPHSAEGHGEVGALYLLLGDQNRALMVLTEAVRLAPNCAQYQLDKARAHRQAGDLTAAEEAFRRTIAIDKQNAKAWAALGEIYADQKPAEAVDCFSKAIAILPENAYYHTAKGETLMKLPGRREEAMASLDRASQLDPGNAELHAQIGRLLDEAGNTASALHHFQASINLSPTDPDVFYRMARLELDTHPDLSLLYINSAIALSVTRGDYYFLKAKAFVALWSDEESMALLLESADKAGHPSEEEMQELRGGDSLRLALGHINRAIEMDPENAAYLSMRARLLYLLGQKNKALDQYKKLLEKNPEQHEALFGMAQILADHRDQKALDHFRRAILLAPAVAEYHAGLAAFLAQEETRWQAAVEEYTAAVEINRSAWQYLLEMARLLDRHGQIPEALQAYRRVLLIRPRVAEASRRSGILLAGPAPEHAAIYLDQAIKVEPENYIDHIWRGRVRHALGLAKAGDEDFEQAIILGKEGPEVYFDLACTLAEPMPERALEYCKRAIEIEEERPAYHILRGDLQLALGGYADAQTCYEWAAALDPGSHEALEKLAKVCFLRGDSACKEKVEAALRNKPNCPECLYIKARILDELEGDVASALEYIGYALELKGDSILFQEKLVALLAKKRALLRLVVEKSRLAKMRRKLTEPMELPDPPDFGAAAEETQDAQTNRSAPEAPQTEEIPEDEQEEAEKSR